MKKLRSTANLIGSSIVKNIGAVITGTFGFPRVMLSVSVIAFLLAAVVVTGCGNTEANTEKPAEQKEKITLVKTEVLNAQQFTDFIALVGTVEPVKTSNVASATGGKIIAFYVDKGSYVGAGQVICVLDNDEMQSMLDAAKAQYELAEISFQKMEAVYKENVTSEFKYLEAKYQRDIAKANYERMQKTINNTYVRAPFAGIIDAKHYEIGEVCAPGMPIVTLIATGTVKVNAGVPESYVNQVKVGTPVQVAFPNLSETEYTATVTYVGSSISTDNRTYPIEISIPNPSGLIKPELRADLRIMRQTYESMIVVPEQVLTQTDLGYVAFVTDNGRAKMKVVDIMNRVDNTAALNSGLEPGDSLIVDGYKSLVDGERIKVIK